MANGQFEKDIAAVKALFHKLTADPTAVKTASSQYPTSSQNPISTDASSADAQPTMVEHFGKLSGKRKKQIIGIFAACVTLIVIIVAAVSASGAIDIDLKPYYVFKQAGYQAKGTLAASIDKQKIMSAISSKLTASSSGKSVNAQMATTMAKYQSLIDSIKIVYETKYSLLSNGDTVTVSVTYNEDLARSLKVRLSGLKQSYSVANLKTATVIDAFSGMTVKVSGVSPTASIAVTPAANVRNDVTLKANKTSGLKNGDSVTITATLGNSSDANPKELAASSTTYVVTGASERFASAGQWTSQIKEYCQNLAKTKAESYQNSYSAYRIMKNALGEYSQNGEKETAYYSSDLKITHTYLLTFNKNNAVSQLFMVTESNITDPEKNRTVTVFFPICFENLLVADGKVVGVDSVTIGKGYDSIDKFINTILKSKVDGKYIEIPIT